MLDIRLFGAKPELLWQGEPLALPQRLLTLEFLAYLLLQSGSLIPRAVAAADLWPDQTERRAYKNISYGLSFLQNYLPQTETEQPWLCVSRFVVCWNEDSPYRLDTEVFESVDPVRLSAKPRTALAKLESAVDLYSDKLLPSIDSDWLCRRRLSLRNLYVWMLERHAEIAEVIGDGEAACWSLQQLCREEPHREYPRRRLMMMLYLLGQRDQAMEQYADLRALARHQFGIGPSLESRAVAAVIEEGLPLEDLEWVRARLGQSADEDALGVDAESEPPHTVVLPPAVDLFAERRDLVAKVVASFERRQIVSLVGPPGVGKSMIGIEVGHTLMQRMAGRVFRLDLQNARSGSDVARTLTLSLGLGRVPVGSALLAAQDMLASEASLLIFDNCESCISACLGALAVLQKGCSDLLTLFTSRAPLGTHRESVIVVPPLDVPGLDVRLASSVADWPPACRYFAERVDSVRGSSGTAVLDQDAMIGICRSVDGIPAAIDMAAGKASVLSLGEVNAQLRESMHSLWSRSRSSLSRRESFGDALEASLNQVSREARQLAKYLSDEWQSYDDAVMVSAAKCVDVDLDEASRLVEELLHWSLAILEYPEADRSRFRLLTCVKTHLASDSVTES